MRPTQQIINEGNAIIQAQANLLAEKESIIISQKSEILRLNMENEQLKKVHDLDQKTFNEMQRIINHLNALLDQEISKWQSISLLCIIFAAIMGLLMIDSY